MRKLKEELSHKYAYNINESTRKKKVTVGSGKDFQQLNHGFYEEIENNDISIKQKQKQLQKIKNDSLKEFVFSNRQIPDKWKKKLNYQNDVIKILAKDTNFLLYIGRGGNPKMGETISTGISTGDSFHKNSGLKTCYSQLFPRISNKFLSLDEKKVKTIIRNNKEHKTLEEDLSNNENTISASKIAYPKLKNHSKREFMTDKDISNLLEEFRLAYPIKIQKEEKHVNEVSSDNKNNENDLPNGNIFFGKTYNSTNNILNPNISSNPFANIHRLKLDKRQRAFRQNIFNNLIPPKKLKASNSMINLSSNGKIKIKKIKKNEKLSPFLNDSESFYKKTKIDNPIILKNLENINFYGPYYAYCPPCLNRNLEFYNNLEPNQCLKLIKFIRKMRGKKNIINIKEKSINLSEKKPEKKEYSISEDIGNINDNEAILEKKESAELSQ